MRSIRDEVLHIRNLCNQLLDRMAKDEPTLPGMPKITKPKKSPVSDWERELMEAIRGEAKKHSPGIIYADPYPVGEVFSLHRLQKTGTPIGKLKELIAWSWTQDYWRGRICDASCLLRDLSRLSAQFLIAKATATSQFLGQVVSDEELRDGDW